MEKGDLEKGRLGDEESGGRGNLEKRVIRFLFVGTLSKGKRPLYALQLAEQLHVAGYRVYLDLYGEGAERNALETYIQEKGLQDVIMLHGNQTAATVQTAYENSHFLVLPSQSEGWPKVVAEAMFWGCVPIASAISCVPNMLGNGERGIILTMDLEKDIQQIKRTLDNEALYQSKAGKAVLWSRQYTLDYFEEEIRLLLGS
ncbi:glycosyltransferase family 4 protein [Flavobacterium sp.]|uniref:glycosyltransferase family 4 protein n=1 Tax=Flavobacterium sp. TaxID=239 RepID=UPI002B4B5C03|nr:glycosyltransferase family 4 protein [Flavobacterium sp.]HLF52417.1 glycosyltransferase family 4 protein [Flavobacterium sp.]